LKVLTPFLKTSEEYKYQLPAGLDGKDKTVKFGLLFTFAT